MNIPPSSLFTPLDLGSHFNVDQQTLSGSLQPPGDLATVTGQQCYLGIPFACGALGQANAILLNDAPVRIEFGQLHATYLLFLHVVETRTTSYLTGFADDKVDGNELGDLVADYALGYADGSSAQTPILRRFAIQQRQIAWGASAFEAMPAVKANVVLTVSEELALGRKPEAGYGRGETRHFSGRDSVADRLWLYALPNPHPEKALSSLVLTPKNERALVYAITTTQVVDHPLRPGVRQKLRLTLPDGARLNKLGELDLADVQIDLGNVISARAALNYDAAAWQSKKPNVQPLVAGDAVIIEYAAHPQARLYIATGASTHAVYDLNAAGNKLNDQAARIKSEAGVSGDLITINPAHRPVTLRVIDKASGQPVPVRIHLHGAQGEYLPPRGNHRRVNGNWFEDNYGEFVNGQNQYAYINGECVADLPLGEVYIEINKGYEVTPIRTQFTVLPTTTQVVFKLEKVLRWRERGWVTADTHVHFLSPTTALLEGQAEGVHVVNLLASQWGEMFSNVSDFDGKSTLGAREFGGDGEFLVRVGTENRMQVLGHISLLGYSGAMIHPLCSGGPSESAIGDPLEVSMAEWAQRCADQGGLVIMPHAPNPQLERAADIVLGLVHGIELMTFNPFDWQINPYGLADWYRYLNLGYHVPVVGGSDKMSQSSLLGGVRTYAHLGERAFSYNDWMAAVKAGNTFVTVGPLAALAVEGVAPGGRIDLPTGGGTLNIQWRVESVSLPIEQIEVVVGGLVAEQFTVDHQLVAAGSASLKINTSSWVALRVRGSYRNIAGEIAAHTSAVMVTVGGQPHFVQKDAAAVLAQIEGALAYVDTLATRPAAERLRQLRATIETAHHRLHQRMHQHGLMHQHTPVQAHD